MISGLVVSQDAAGFPVVTWNEFRGLHSRTGTGTHRVECRIMKDPSTGTLLFVARGHKRRSSFEDGNAWEALQGFSQRGAETLYYTKAELELRHHMAGKGLGSKIAFSDNGQVLLAEFGGAEPVHINDTEASPFDLERLHLILSQAFLRQRSELVSALCKDAYLWPVTDGKVQTYDPEQRGWPGERLPTMAQHVIATVFAMAVILGAFALLLRFVDVF